MEHILDIVFSFWGYLGLTLLAAIVAFIAGLIRQHRLGNWPAAQGTIETHEMRTGAGKDGVDVAVVAYSYRVNGELYAGYYRQALAADEAPIGLFAACPKGASVIVHYDPRHPDRSEMENPKKAYLGPGLR